MVPAYAGVILKWLKDGNEDMGGSRIRGGDPKIAISGSIDIEWFPHTRG